MRRPLVLTGASAAGKSTCARELASRADHAAARGRQRLCPGPQLPGRRFDVVIADVVTPATAARYRSELPDCLLVRLVVTLEEARRRAATRLVYLSDVLDEVWRANPSS